MVSIALEFFNSNLLFSKLNKGNGKRRLMSEAEVIIPEAFSYQEIGVHLLTFLNSFCKRLKAFPPEKKNSSCPFFSSFFPSGITRETCPKPSSEQHSISRIIPTSKRQDLFYLFPIPRKNRKNFIASPASRVLCCAIFCLYPLYK